MNFGGRYTIQTITRGTENENDWRGLRGTCKESKRVYGAKDGVAFSQMKNSLCEGGGFTEGTSCTLWSLVWPWSACWG